jgi:choline kinase
MGSATDGRPKCLIALDGRPLLQRQISALGRAAVGEILVVGGYRADMLRALGLRVAVAPGWRHSNMVRSLQAAAPWLRTGDCIVSYGDIVCSAETVRHLVAAPPPVAIAYDPGWLRLWNRRFADPLSDAENFSLREDGSLLRIGGRLSRLQDAQGQYMGLLRISPPGWEMIERLLGSLPAAEVDHLDMTALLQLLVDDGLKIWAVPSTGDWVEVDSTDDLVLYEHLLRVGEVRLE